MVWQTIGEIEVSSEWQFTEPLLGEFFKFKHTLNGTPPYRTRGLICQASFETGALETYQRHLIYPNDDVEVWQLVSPDCFTKRRIGIRKVRSRTVIYSSFRWMIEVQANK